MRVGEKRVTGNAHHGHVIRLVEESDEEKNVLLRSKAAGLTVARLDVMRSARGASPLPETADLVVNLNAGGVADGVHDRRRRGGGPGSRRGSGRRGQLGCRSRCFGNEEM
jgi:hypothetical protein